MLIPASIACDSSPLDEAEKHLASGKKLFHEQGRLSDAIAAFDKAILLNPQLAEAYEQRGSAHRNLGQHQRAIEDFDQSLRINPSRPWALASRGGVYSGLGHYERAIEDYNEAIRVHPELAKAYAGRAAAYGNLGQHQSAIGDFNEAIVLREFQLLSKEDSDETIQKDSQLATSYNGRGLAYFELGEHQRALSDLDEAIRLNPQCALAYPNRALVYTILGSDPGSYV